MDNIFATTSLGLSSNPVRDHGFLILLPESHVQHPILVDKTVKNREGSGNSASLQATKVACHRFTDTGRRPRITDSQTKDSTTHGTASSMRVSTFVSVPFTPQVLSDDAEAQMDGDTHRGLRYRREA